MAGVSRAHFARLPLLCVVVRVDKQMCSRVPPMQVCEWLLQYSLVPARPYGQHSSEQAWRSRANKRRDAVAPKPLHIAGLLQRLRDVVCALQALCNHKTHVRLHLVVASQSTSKRHSVQLHSIKAQSEKLLTSIDCRLTRCSSCQGRVDASYPPQGLKSAVELFLAGSPAVDAFQGKLAYLQYTLLDLNVPSVCAGLRYANTAESPMPLGIPCRLAVRTSCDLLMEVAYQCRSVDGRVWSRRDGLGLPAAGVEQTRAGFLLDEAACGQDAGGALQEACRILPGALGFDGLSTFH